MSPHEQKTVFLVNQISRHGHLDLYARLYSNCLIRLGYKVVLIAEQDPGVAEGHGVSSDNHVANLICFTRHELRKNPSGSNDNSMAASATSVAAIPVSWIPGMPALLSRVRRVWRTEGLSGIVQRCGLYGRRPFDHLVSLGRRTFGRLGRIAGAVPHKGTWLAAVAPKMFSTLMRFIDHLPSQRGVSFAELVQEIGAAEVRLGVRPSLVLFLYLDMMSEDRRGCRYLEANLDALWAGILFHPRLAVDGGGRRPERYFSCRNARGAAFLNPGPVAGYAKMFPRCSFGIVPDVTDAALPAAEPELVERLFTRAAGRTIVAQLGSISPHKNMMQLIDVVHRADPQRYFFAIIGEVFWDSFGADEGRLRQFFAAAPENCLAEAGYLADERELNSVIAKADILYAIYSDFRGSSNTLTKAATFEKPVIVSDEYVMGERVRRYDIGAVVRNGDIADIISGLETLRRRPRSEFGFAAYRRDNSIEALEKSLADLVGRWLSDERSG